MNLEPIVEHCKQKKNTTHIVKSFQMKSDIVTIFDWKTKTRQECEQQTAYLDHKTC